jgi:dGTP triphosphohydrolase
MDENSGQFFGISLHTILGNPPFGISGEKAIHLLLGRRRSILKDK